MTDLPVLDLKAQLEAILASEPDSIAYLVAKEALDYHCPKAFFMDLFTQGCASGMITSLVYYHDTHAFFDKYYNEIEYLREEADDNLSEPILIKGDLKNVMAWFAFEETAFQMAAALRLEI